MLNFVPSCILLYKYKVGDKVRLGKYRSGGHPLHREGIITKLTVSMNYGIPEPSYCIRHKYKVSGNDGPITVFETATVFETTIMEKTC